MGLPHDAAVIPDFVRDPDVNFNRAERSRGLENPDWIPACAGMTIKRQVATYLSGCAGPACNAAIAVIGDAIGNGAALGFLFGCMPGPAPSTGVALRDGTTAIVKCLDDGAITLATILYRARCCFLRGEVICGAPGAARPSAHCAPAAPICTCRHRSGG
ncbi:hypothetical protein ATL17_1519 [Maritalea mobilis]|uniref:Uncharacterized protein n=1 Tax=Maritalea mobilis TaxID=483324 RepID=A0A4R6VXH8_9HYPH|nr:hypothetical protein ATL17_1519 [Maritalea mobilis]